MGTAASSSLDGWSTLVAEAARWAAGGILVSSTTTGWGTGEIDEDIEARCGRL